MYSYQEYNPDARLTQWVKNYWSASGITKKIDKSMKFSNVRLLVKDYETCFKFYTEKLGLEAAWNLEG